MSDNPYAPASATTGGYVQGQIFDISDAEMIRKQHLSHEASIQGMGSLYLLGGVLGSLGGLVYGGMGIAAMSGVAGAIPDGDGPGPTPAVMGGMFVGIGVFVLAVSMAQLYAGWTMRKLDPKGKILAIIVTAIGLLGFPCGTLISAYTLYLLLSPKGEFIYSPQYKEIRAATPHIKYRSIVAWVLLALILIFVVLLFLAAFLGGMR
ncbi:MAG: hypothetical protein ACK5PZ_03525 [Pirellula sp.]|jgi:hypothetical protein